MVVSYSWLVVNSSLIRLWKSSPSTNKNQARCVVLRDKASYRQVSCRPPKPVILIPKHAGLFRILA
jgi:hypothetical protein